MTPLLETTVQRYRGGMSLRQIAVVDRVGLSAIWGRLQRAGEKRRPVGLSRLPVYEIIKAYDEFQSWERVAQYLGMNSRNAAFVRARRAGFTSRDISAFRLLNEHQREVYRLALDEDRLSHEDALEIALEY